MKTWMTLLILLVGLIHSAADKVSYRHSKPSHTAGTRELSDRSVRTRRILQAVEAVSVIADEHNKSFIKTGSITLAKNRIAKIFQELDKFHDADDLMVLAKCFDGLRRSCGEDGDSAFLDIFDEAYLHCLNLLSINYGSRAGINLKDLILNQSFGEEKLYTSKLIAKHAKREEAATRK